MIDDVPGGFGEGGGVDQCSGRQGDATGSDEPHERSEPTCAGIVEADQSSARDEAQRSEHGPDGHTDGQIRIVSQV